MRRKHNDSFDFFNIIESIVAIIILFVAIVILFISYRAENTAVVEITVIDKSTVGSKPRYLVWSMADGNIEIFETKDTGYGRLKIGRAYVAMVNGIKIPTISAYRNVIKILEEKDNG